MVHGSTTARPLIHINFIKQVVNSLAPLLFGAFLLSIAFLSNTTKAQAFWPFAGSVKAEAGGIIPSASTPTLVASNNSNPTASAPSLLAMSQGSALVSYQGPDGVPSGDSIVTPATSQISSYIVKSGDTLSEIAALYGVSVNTIVWANNLGSNKSIHAGQVLAILPVSGIEHTVAKGETLASLAKKYGGDANDIADYNGLGRGAVLAVGSAIIIPGGELSVPSTPVKGSTHISGSTREPYLGGSGAEIDGYYDNPVPGAVLTQSIHGWNAVDLGAGKGTPIHAAAAGTVVVSMANGAWNGGYGNYVVISHGNGTETLYAHMSRDIVDVGQTVSQDEIIGYVGSTGESTGSHLHFEVRGAKNPFSTCPTGATCEPK